MSGRARNERGGNRRSGKRPRASPASQERYAVNRCFPVSHTRVCLATFLSRPFDAVRCRWLPLRRTRAQTPIITQLPTDMERARRHPGLSGWSGRLDSNQRVALASLGACAMRRVFRGSRVAPPTHRPSGRCYPLTRSLGQLQSAGVPCAWMRRACAWMRRACAWMRRVGRGEPRPPVPATRAVGGRCGGLSPESAPWG